MPVKIINSPSCSHYTICVESPKKSMGHNICFGDSGGPLICQVPDTNEWVLQGVTGYLINAEKYSIYKPRLETAVYTSVYVFKPWIIAVKNLVDKFYGR